MRQSMNFCATIYSVIIYCITWKMPINVLRLRQIVLFSYEPAAVKKSIGNLDGQIMSSHQKRNLSFGTAYGWIAAGLCMIVPKLSQWPAG
jgi:hypothetical protein